LILGCEKEDHHAERQHGHPQNATGMEDSRPDAALSLFFPDLSHAFPGEIFKIEAVGIDFCGDFNFSKFNKRNNIDLWVRLE
jgi:hypothetical protein